MHNSKASRGAWLPAFADKLPTAVSANEPVVLVREQISKLLKTFFFFQCC